MKLIREFQVTAKANKEQYGYDYLCTCEHDGYYIEIGDMEFEGSRMYCDASDVETIKAEVLQFVAFEYGLPVELCKCRYIGIDDAYPED